MRRQAGQPKTAMRRQVRSNEGSMTAGFSDCQLNALSFAIVASCQRRQGRVVAQTGAWSRAICRYPLCREATAVTREYEETAENGVFDGAFTT
jgi:hypothetical protein